MGKLLFPSSSLICFFIFLCVTKLATSQSHVLDEFCRQVTNPNFCLTVVGSDPRSKTAQSAHDLEGLTIDLGSTVAKAVENNCFALLDNETDPIMKITLGSCAGAYSLVALNFDSMRAAFQSGTSIGQQGAESAVAVSKCDYDFLQKGLTSPFTQDNFTLLNFIQIILDNSSA